MDVMDALKLRGGAARWTRLREMGVGERALRAASRDGTVLRVGRGGYALADAPAGLVAAVALGGVASHVTAAYLHGWEPWNPDLRLVVTVPQGTVKSHPGIEVHRADLAPADLDSDRDCTSALRTAIDCGRCLPFVDAVVILDTALRKRAVTERQLVAAANQSRGPGAPELRRAVANVDPRCGSELESVLRLLLRSTNAQLRTQARIPGVGDVDFLVDGWLVVEGDGYEFHSSRADYKEDRRRLNAITARGFGLLRFTWEDVRFRPLWVLAEVERVRQLRRP
ncbi:MAG: hypothetical protein ACT4QG_01695 [Sporichthyaceae bacterium]